MLTKSAFRSQPKQIYQWDELLHFSEEQQKIIQSLAYYCLQSRMKGIASTENDVKVRTQSITFILPLV